MACSLSINASQVLSLISPCPIGNMHFFPSDMTLITINDLTTSIAWEMNNYYTNLVVIFFLWIVKVIILVRTISIWYLVLYDPVNKELRAYSWPKKEIIFKDGKQFKVFTGRGLMTLSKEKIIKVLESCKEAMKWSDADQRVPQYRA